MRIGSKLHLNNFVGGCMLFHFRRGHVIKDLYDFLWWGVYAYWKELLIFTGIAVVLWFLYCIIKQGGYPIVG